MRSRLLLGLVASTFVLVAFPGCGHGAEPGGPSSQEEEGDPRKGNLALSRFPRTTLRQKHRIGSFSALSRGLVANLSKLEDARGEGEASWQGREANRTHGGCWGCCGTQLPDRNGSRQGVSFLWVKLNGHQGSNATLDRCQGCCGRNSSAIAKLPERKDEEGKGSPSAEDGPIRHPWKPILEREVPNERPSQKGEDGRWTSFPIDPIEPWRHQRGP